MIYIQGRFFSKKEYANLFLFLTLEKVQSPTLTILYTII